MLKAKGPDYWWPTYLPTKTTIHTNKLTKSQIFGNERWFLMIGLFWTIERVFFVVYRIKNSWQHYFCRPSYLIWVTLYFTAAPCTPGGRVNEHMNRSGHESVDVLKFSSSNSKNAVRTTITTVNEMELYLTDENENVELLNKYYFVSTRLYHNLPQSRGCFVKVV